MQSWRRVRWVIGLAATLLATGMALLPGSPAQAHATLVETSPVNGTALTEAPSEVRLRFSERVSVGPDSVTLRDAGGATIATDPPFIPSDAPTVVVLPVPSDLDDGGYVVTFRIVSADSHPISGALVFGVGVPANALADVEIAPDDRTVPAVFTVARWSGYAGLALLAGGLAVFVLCWPAGWSNPRARRVVLVGWFASLAGGLASLLLQGPYTAGRSLAGLVDPALLSTTLGTDYGRYLLVRLTLIVLAGVLIFAGGRLAPRVRTGAAIGLGVALPATWVGTGHANTATSPIDLIADVAHLAAMMTWFGGLALLAICLLPRKADVPAEEVGPTLRRFSLLATGAVITIVLTGIYLSWQRVGTLDALVGTTYGRLLALKIAFIGVLLWLGAISRSVVQRRYGAADGSQPAGKRPKPGSRADQEAERDARLRLRQSVRLEVGTAVAVLAVASVLVATPPGVTVALNDAQAAPAAAFAPVRDLANFDAEGVVQLNLEPGVVGANDVLLEVLDLLVTPREVAEMRASLTLPEQDLGPIPLELEEIGPGAYQALEVQIPFPGTWQLDVTVRTSEIDSSTVRFEVPIS